MSFWDLVDKYPWGSETYEADWELYGRAAGPMRNRKMLEIGKPDLVVAFPGGIGTANMVKQALAAGVRVIEVCPGFLFDNAARAMPATSNAGEPK